MPIITIFRGTLSGGTELARCLGAKLGYRIVSREDLVEEASRTYGIEEAKLLRGLGRGPRFLDRFRIDRKIYLTAAQATLCRLAMGDRLVYHGHAGHFLLSGVRHVIRVRIVAPLAHRIQVARREYGLTEKEAEDMSGNGTKTGAPGPASSSRRSAATQPARSSRYSPGTRSSRPRRRTLPTSRRSFSRPM